MIAPFIDIDRDGRPEKNLQSFDDGSGTKRCRVLSQDDGTSSSDRRFYTVPEQYQQSLGDRWAHCRVLRTLPAFGHSIARRSLDEVLSS
jgi:hypothetical protein